MLRDHEQHEPERRVGDLPLEVEVRIRPADRGRRRGRRVDHHDPERDERKGDEDQDPRLELAPPFPPTHSWGLRPGPAESSRLLMASRGSGARPVDESWTELARRLSQTRHTFLVSVPEGSPVPPRGRRYARGESARGPERADRRAELAVASCSATCASSRSSASARRGRRGAGTRRARSRSPPRTSRRAAPPARAPARPGRQRRSARRRPRPPSRFQLIEPRHHEPEQHVAEQVDRRPGRDDEHLGGRQHVGRVRDHELVADRADDDPGDEHDVEVRVAVAREQRPVRRRLEPPLRRSPRRS